MMMMTMRCGLAQVWQRLDDVIMGGKSDSALAVAAEDSDASAVWRGELITEGGGFCGARTASQDWDLGSYDGILLRVRGDGQTYKMNLKTVSTRTSMCKQHACRLYLGCCRRSQFTVSSQSLPLGWLQMQIYHSEDTINIK